MKKIKKFKKSEPITIEIKKRDFEQDDLYDWAKRVDEGLERKKAEKPKKKHKKTADELFEQAGYEKAYEDKGIVRYSGPYTGIAIKKSRCGGKDDYIVLTTTSDGARAQWLDKATIKAIRRKAKEKGWR